MRQCTLADFRLRCVRDCTLADLRHMYVVSALCPPQPVDQNFRRAEPARKPRPPTPAPLAPGPWPLTPRFFVQEETLMWPLHMDSGRQVVGEEEKALLKFFSGRPVEMSACQWPTYYDTTQVVHICACTRGIKSPFLKKAIPLSVSRSDYVTAVRPIGSRSVCLRMYVCTHARARRTHRLATARACVTDRPTDDTHDTARGRRTR